jgi:hypothetical protein
MHHTIRQKACIVLNCTPGKCNGYTQKIEYTTLYVKRPHSAQLLLGNCNGYTQKIFRLSWKKRRRTELNPETGSEESLNIDQSRGEVAPLVKVKHELSLYTPLVTFFEDDMSSLLFDYLDNLLIHGMVRSVARTGPYTVLEGNRTGIRCTEISEPDASLYVFMAVKGTVSPYWSAHTCKWYYRISLSWDM